MSMSLGFFNLDININIVYTILPTHSKYTLKIYHGYLTNICFKFSPHEIGTLVHNTFTSGQVAKILKCSHQ